MGRQGFQGHLGVGAGAPQYKSRSAAMFDDDSRYSGNMFVDTELVSVMKSQWPMPQSRLKNFDTVMRILPGIEDDGSWGPYRVHPGRGQFGSWLYSSWAARSIGDPPVTFFLCSYEQKVSNTYDPRNHPVYKLYNEIYWAVEAGTAKELQLWWGPMVNSKTKKVIKKPAPMYLVQSLIYHRGDKNYDPPMGADDGEKIVVFDLANDGGKTLGAALELRQRYEDPNNAPSWQDFNEYYVHGDIIDLDGGKFVQVFPAHRDPMRDEAPPQRVEPGQRRTLSRAAVNAGRQRGQEEEDGREKIGYGVRILDEFDGWSPRIEPEFRESLQRRAQRWDDILLFPDHKECAQALWSRMRFGGELKLDVLFYAWRDHQDWLPTPDSDAYAEWVSRTQVAPGANYNPDAGVQEDQPAPRRWGGRPSAQQEYEEADHRPRGRSREEFPEDQPMRRRAQDTDNGSLLPEDQDESPEESKPAAAPAPEPAPAVNGSALFNRQQAEVATPPPARATRASYQPRAKAEVQAPSAAPGSAVDVAAGTPFRPSAAAAAALGAIPPAEPAPAAPTEPAPPASAETPPKLSAKDMLAAARAKLRG
jgi:hypothetical protein